MSSVRGSCPQNTRLQKEEAKVWVSSGHYWQERDRYRAHRDTLPRAFLLPESRTQDRLKLRCVSGADHVRGAVARRCRGTGQTGKLCRGFRSVVRCVAAAWLRAHRRSLNFSAQGGPRARPQTNPFYHYPPHPTPEPRHPSERPERTAAFRLPFSSFEPL